MLKDWKRSGSSILSLIVLLSLFMPWITLTAPGLDVTFSGMNAAVVDRRIEAIAVVIFAVVGLASLVLPLAVRVLIGAGGLVSMVIFSARLLMGIADAQDQTDWSLGVNFEFGFGLTLLAFLIIAALQFLPLGNNHDRTRYSSPGA